MLKQYEGVKYLEGVKKIVANSLRITNIAKGYMMLALNAEAKAMYFEAVAMYN